MPARRRAKSVLRGAAKDAPLAELAAVGVIVDAGGADPSTPGMNSPLVLESDPFPIPPLVMNEWNTARARPGWS